MAVNPNPQSVLFSAFEAPTLTITMTPPTNVSGWTFILNVRNKAGTLLFSSTAANVTDPVNGVFTFLLTSPQTGTTIGVGDYLYDVWRTNVGSEKRLVYGPLSVLPEQWK